MRTKAKRESKIKREGKEREWKRREGNRTSCAGSLLGLVFSYHRSTHMHACNKLIAGSQFPSSTWWLAAPFSCKFSPPVTYQSVQAGTQVGSIDRRPIWIYLYARWYTPSPPIMLPHPRYWYIFADRIPIDISSDYPAPVSAELVGNYTHPQSLLCTAELRRHHNIASYHNIIGMICEGWSCL